MGAIGQLKSLRIFAAMCGFLLPIVWLLPSFTGESAFFPADYWFKFSQWVPAFGQYFDQVPYNAVLYDVALHVAPSLWAVKESWSAGDLPLWNQYFRTGAPLLANGQSGIFAITNLPHWLLPWPYGFAAAATVKFGLMWLGSWLFARVLGIRPILSAAVAFGFCFMPTFMSWFQHPNANSQVWFPWLLWSVEKYRRNWSKSNFGYWIVLPGLFEGLALLGGHFHSSFNITVCATTYAMVVLPVKTLRLALLSRAIFILSLIGGVCFAGPTVFPGVEFIMNSSTLIERANNDHYHLSVKALLLFWDAFTFGSPVLALNKPWTFNETNWAVAQQYIGLMPWVLLLGGGLCGGFASLRLRQSMLGLFAMAVIGGSMAFGWVPLFDLLIKVPPFSVNTNPYFAIGLQGAVITASALLWTKLPGFGKKPKVSVKIAWVFCAVMGIGFLWVITRVIVIDPLRPTLMLYGSCVAVVALAVCRGRLQTYCSLLLVLSLWVADVLPVWKGFHYQVPLEWAKISNAKSNNISAMQDNKISRTISDACYPPNTLAFFGIQDVRAYDYPIHLRHAKWRTLFGNEGNTNVNMDNLNAAQLSDQQAVSMLALTGAPAMVSVVDYRNSPISNYLRFLSNDGGARLYAFMSPVPVAGIYNLNDVQYAQEADAAHALLSTWRLGKEYTPTVEAAKTSTDVSTDINNRTITMSRLGAGKIVYKLDKQTRPVWLVVRESFDGGWSASAGGETLDIVPADIKFMAMKIPPGVHQVTLTYFPTSFGWGVIANMLSVSTGLIVSLGPKRWRKWRSSTKKRLQFRLTK